MTADPLLTIAIPTFRRLGLLREATESALHQTYSAFEVLISDDGDCEAIRDFGQDLAQLDPRVRYVHTPSRLGLAGNWNWCALQARGSHLVLIGDDDRLHADFLMKLAPHTELFDVVFSDHVLIDREGAVLPNSPSLLRRFGRGRLRTGALMDTESVAWMNAVPPSATLVSRELVMRLQFDSALNTPELDFYVRAASAGASFYFYSEPLVEYRIHADSATAGGLTIAALFRKVAAFQASSSDSRRARFRQLATLAPVAVRQALFASDNAVISVAKDSWALWGSAKGILLRLSLLLPRPVVLALLLKYSRFRVLLRNIRRQQRGQGRAT